MHGKNKNGCHRRRMELNYLHNPRESDQNNTKQKTDFWNPGLSKQRNTDIVSLCILTLTSHHKSTELNKKQQQTNKAHVLSRSSTDARLVEVQQDRTEPELLMGNRLLTSRVDHKLMHTTSFTCVEKEPEANVWPVRGVTGLHMTTNHPARKRAGTQQSQVPLCPTVNQLKPNQQGETSGRTHAEYKTGESERECFKHPAVAGSGDHQTSRGAVSSFRRLCSDDGPAVHWEGSHHL